MAEVAARSLDSNWGWGQGLEYLGCVALGLSLASTKSVCIVGAAKNLPLSLAVPARLRACVFGGGGGDFAPRGLCVAPPERGRCVSVCATAATGKALFRCGCLAPRLSRCVCVCVCVRACVRACV